jgi:putative transposase
LSPHGRMSSNCGVAFSGCRRAFARRSRREAILRNHSKILRIPTESKRYVYMRRYQRRLPHYDAVGERLFVTFRLHGSLPASRIVPPQNLTSGKAFLAMDRLPDAARLGPVYLRQPEIAKIVEQALLNGEIKFQRYALHAFLIMLNHVHLLVESRVPTARWLGSLKGLTAHAANRLLGLRGPFFQDESYDRLVRNVDEFDRILRYIENNPVAAGLVHTRDEFLWSSAPGGSPAAGRKACPTKALGGSEAL